MKLAERSQVRDENRLSDDKQGKSSQRTSFPRKVTGDLGRHQPNVALLRCEKIRYLVCVWIYWTQAFQHPRGCNSWEAWRFWKSHEKYELSPKKGIGVHTTNPLFACNNWEEP